MKKQYRLHLISGILALSSSVVLAAPGNDFHRSAERVQIKAQQKASAKYQKSGRSTNDYGRSNWNDRLEVRAQMRLKRLGFYRGPVDGDFGRGSRSALVRFQYSKRLRPTGSLDSRTVRALGF